MALLVSALGAAMASPARADEPATDHARVVGGVGVGWFGVSEIPLGELSESLVAPAIGARWWFSERVGLDVGIGLAVLSGQSSTAQDGTTTLEDEGPSSVGALIHLGAPIALYAGRHYTLLVVPELNAGFATSTTERRQTGVLEAQITERSGARIDLGGRIGAEIHFGFIGIPELALEASVGLFVTHLRAEREQGGAASAASSTQLSTTSFNDPWDFFRSAVAARYYF